MSGASRARRRSASGAVGADGGVLRALVAQVPRELAGVDVGDPDDAVAREVRVERLLARQLEATGLASRTTKPATRGASPTASVSSALTPTLPISGAVIVTICPQYEGSVRTSW